MKNLSDIIISILVIVCSVALLLALMITVQDNPFAKPEFKFTIDFADAPGIKRNSQVTYAGQPIGSVTEVEILAPAKRMPDLPGHIVRLHVEVTEKIPIPRNVKPTITATSMLGENLVTLGRVDDEGGLLGDGAQLVGFSTGPLDALAPGATEILDGVNEAVQRVNDILTKIQVETIQEELEASLTNLRQITEKVEASLEGENGIDPLLAKLNEAAEQIVILFAGEEGETEGMNPQFDEILENIRQITENVNASLAGDEGLLARVNSAAAGLDRTINGPEGEPDKALQKQIAMLAKEIQVLLVYAQYFTGSLAEKPRRLLFGDNEELDIPTKEAILKFIEENGGNVPVPAIGEEGVPAGGGGSASSEGDEPERRRPIRNLFRKR